MGGVFLYYNKVEISGVNTAKLKVLKESEKTELLRQMRSGDPTAREIFWAEEKTPTIFFRSDVSV